LQAAEVADQDFMQVVVAAVECYHLLHHYR
jgi:hypothetical protein